MHKLNLKATFRLLLHLKFTGSRIIVISWASFMKMVGIIVNYLKKKSAIGSENAKFQNIC